MEKRSIKALVLKAFNTYPAIGELELPALNEGMAEIEVKAVALNRRDFYITQGLYPGVEFPVVLGSDVSGIYNDKEVILNPNINWGANEAVQSDAYHILGMPSWGGMAQYVQVAKDRIYPKPAHLTLEEASALPLAGLTAFRAIKTKGNCKAGEKVLINGIGGGVATFAFQFALAMGAEVYVTSGSDEKLNKALQMGAKGTANYKAENWHKQLAKDSGGFDLIIDSAGGKGFANLAKLCRPAARVVFYGGTRGKIEGLSPQILFWRQVTVMGTTMGSDKDFEDMLAFVNSHKIKPVIDSVLDWKESNQAFEILKASSQMGKVVLRVGE
ncbi:MAG: zinc-binding dehydrogenase [Saprospiraceae bacterium]|nr:zinc-binding dehydrogenase [Saprospiraceae bacterium]